jgi:predicted DNA-binding transcriptional regulator AlpA
MTAAKGMIDSIEAAALLGIAEPTLRQWRSEQRDQPVYYKTGGRVRYKVRDIESWIARQAVSH